MGQGTITAFYLVGIRANGPGFETDWIPGIIGVAQNAYSLTSTSPVTRQVTLQTQISHTKSNACTYNSLEAIS